VAHLRLTGELAVESAVRIALYGVSGKKIGPVAIAVVGDTVRPVDLPTAEVRQLVDDGAGVAPVAVDIQAPGADKHRVLPLVRARVVVLPAQRGRGLVGGLRVNPPKKVYASA
jgi:hypothetical protein